MTVSRVEALSSSCSGNTRAACLRTAALLEQSLLETLWMVEMTRESRASSLDRDLLGETWGDLLYRDLWLMLD